MNTGNIRTIYENNEPNKTALKGNISRLLRRFSQHSIPIDKNALYRASGEYQSEYGGNFLNKTRTVIATLFNLGEAASANCLINSFAVLTATERRKLSFNETLEQAFGLLADYARTYRTNRTAFDLVRFRLIALMQTEVV